MVTDKYLYFRKNITTLNILLIFISFRDEPRKPIEISLKIHLVFEASHREIITLHSSVYRNIETIGIFIKLFSK